MENFESYFKKQQADSNCGFAEEYEVCALSGENFMMMHLEMHISFPMKRTWGLQKGGRELHYRDYKAVCRAFPALMKLQS